MITRPPIWISEPPVAIETIRTSWGTMIHQMTKIHHAVRSRRRKAIPIAMSSAAYTRFGTTGIVNIEMAS
jgi:hypothetical protein